MDDSQSRYMVFNAGRFLAFQDHYGAAGGAAAGATGGTTGNATGVTRGGDSRVFDRNVATASAVGHQGRDLWIHCLAASEPAMNLGNPRQVAPHRYSSRFGRLPPCFARATLLPGRSLLLIAGTASIFGEDSLHDDLVGQVDETLANLAAVVEMGRSSQTGDPVRSDPGSISGRRENPLSTLTDIRVYHPRSSDRRPLVGQLRKRLGDRPRFEFLHADLCRSELLVEIEAIADLSDSDSDSDGVNPGAFQ